MNELFKSLFDQLRGTGGGAKAVAFLVGLAVLLLISVVAVVSTEPDYQLAFSNLNDHEVAKVNKALSDAGIAFEVSQPPAPFAVFVDDSARTAAYMAAYGAGALDKPLKGILSDSGMSSVFSSSEERQQGVRKREWEEMESMLEALDFVVAARVRTSPGRSTPFAGRDDDPPSASVTLRLAHNEKLGADQTATVANLVSRGLGVEKEGLIISDQAGNSLFDGTMDEGSEQSMRDILTHEADFDRRETNNANAVLAEILGPNMARVAVSSEWNYEQSTTRSETSTGKGALVSESKNSTERPITDGDAGEGGIAGLAANVADANATGARAPEPNEPLIEKTDEEKKEYRPTITTEERVSYLPTLKRMSIALFIDDDIDAGQAEQIESAIKAAVGFDEDRDDFSTAVLPFAALEELEPSTTPEGAPAEPVAEPNPLMETLLERGVEIVTALVFIVLLLKSLKGSGGKATVTPARATKQAEEVDVELLARAKVEELLKSDPDKVGEILSAWARGEPVGGAKS